MSHLHRNRAANLAVAADAENQHPCTPVVAPELGATNAPAAAARSPRGKRPAAKKAKARSKR